MMENKSSMVVFVLSIVLVLGGFISLYAQEGKIVTAVEVEGNKRVSDLAILSKVKTRVGDEYSSRKLRGDIENLFSSGLFSDIKVDVEDFREGVKVTFIVVERPVVEEVKIQGNRNFQEERLKQEMSLKVGSPFSERTLAKDLENIRKFYQREGFPQVMVDKVVEISEKENKAYIAIKVKEGQRVRIEEIIIQGNKYFTDKEILKAMKSRPKRLFSSGAFKEEVLKEDVKRIEKLYRSRGFLEAEVSKPELKYDASGRLLTIIIKIKEGDQFRVGKIELSGVSVFKTEDILAQLKMKTGDLYSPKGLNDDEDAIQSFYTERGYIFVQVWPDVKIDQKEKVVNLIFDIEEGNIAHIKRIDIVGNVKTKDKVIRREILVRPGDIFDGKKIQRSKEKIYNLGYFEEVRIRTEPTERPDWRNLVFEVKEAKTGAFNFGFGYSSLEEFLGFVELRQNNFDLTNPPTFTGGGQSISLRAKWGEKSQDYSLSFTEPWFRDRPLLLGFDLYNTTTYWTDYDERRKGGGVRLGHPLGEYSRYMVAYKYEEVSITNLVEGVSSAIKEEEGTYGTSSLTLSLSRDTRDNVFDPTRGSRNSISVEYAGGVLGADRNFTKYMGDTLWYFPLGEKPVLSLHLRAGWVDEFSPSDRVPIYERFFLGGANSIRGYDYREVGPKDEEDEPIGGKIMLLGNVEYLFPLVERIKGAFFLDAGNVWSEYRDVNVGDVVTSVGFGVRINIPRMGPVSLDYGYALEEKKGRLHFRMGYGFIF